MIGPDALTTPGDPPRTLREGRAHVRCVEPQTVSAFEPSHWPEVSAASGGRGNAWFVGDDRQQLVLRHYLRGGKAALVSRDRYVYTGLDRTRSFREFDLLLRLYRAGLPVPEPVAALAEPRVLTYRAAILTRAIPAAESLGALLARSRVTDGAMDDVGACIRRFHDAGVWHADLNANNILFDADGRVYLIDFDRGRVRTGAGWADANLARLRRSLDKLAQRDTGSPFDAALWDQLMRAYRRSPTRP